MIPTEIVVLFTLEVMVKSCDLAPHGAKRRAAEPESAMGHTSPWRHVVGSYLLFGVHVFQEGLDSSALKL